MKDLIEQAETLVENTDNSPVGYSYDLRYNVSDFIYKRLKELGKNKKWLSEKIMMKPSQLSRILSAADNLTLHTIARIYWALGGKPEIVNSVFNNREGIHTKNYSTHVEIDQLT
jgi:plasmid maintenance system antidote protein VapI